MKEAVISHFPAIAKIIKLKHLRRHQNLTWQEGNYSQLPLPGMAIEKDCHNDCVIFKPI